MDNRQRTTGEQPKGILLSGRLLLIAAWFALLAGLGEVFLHAVRKFFLHQILNMSPHIAWMAPVAYLFIFAVPGVVFFFIAWRWPERVSLRGAAFVFAFLGFFSLLLMYSKLHMVAVLALAVGLAVQCARLIATHSGGFHTLVRRTAPWLGTLVVGLAAGVHGWEWWGEYRALAKLPAAAPNAPNVLLIVLDTVRARNLSLYGYARPTTPHLERLARSGVRFDRAMSTAPWTLPSHASMFTGRFPSETSAGWELPLDGTYPTLAEVLSAHGYLTAGFVANTFYCSYEHGLNRGFAHYEDYLKSPGQFAASSSLGRTFGCWLNIGPGCGLRRIIGNYESLGRKIAPEVNASFLRWLSGKDQRPFFTFLNYFDAHSPYLPPAPFDTKFGPKRPGRNPVIVAEREWTQEEIQAEVDAYNGAIAYLDQQIGLLFDELEKRNALENTLVILTSDHGEEFGEHGFMEHGFTLYLPSLQVPLLVSFPRRVPAGMTVCEPVSLSDLPATITDLIKLEGDPRFPGNSLARYWDATGGDGSPAASLALSELLGSYLPDKQNEVKKSLLVDGKHYIKNGDGREELYDLENDPLEQHDLAPSGEGRSLLSHFRAILETARSSR